MSIRLFQILLFIFSINNVLSQTISGKIIDAKRLEPVQYSEVTLYDSNSVIIQIVHTDSNNHFHFSNIPKESIILTLLVRYILTCQLLIFY